MLILQLFFFIFVTLLNNYYSVSADCYVKLTSPQLSPNQYNGSWFVIARKAPKSRSFLPKNVQSSTFNLLIQADQTSLSFLEYHKINGSCAPPLKGNLTRYKEGYMISVENNNDHMDRIYVRPIYHGYSGEQNEEMNIVLYGCVHENWDGGCPVGEEWVVIMSNSRHPQTLQLFKSAMLIEEEACIDILHFQALDTYTDCGDEVVDEDQKLRHAQIDENNEFVDVECRVENIQPKPNNISKFFSEPRVLTVIAYIDAELSDEQIAHISCRYETPSNATCEWIRQDTCFKTQLTQKVSRNQITISSSILRLNGSEVPIDWSGFVLWENGDEYISMHCGTVDDDGACDAVRIYVWSDEDHMDQPTIHEIYRQLQAVCVDPTDLIFLNTFHECIVPPPSTNNSRCSVPIGWSPLTINMLDGVWYVAADLNDEPKIFLQSAVVNMTRRANESDILDITYFAQKESDAKCIGPGRGQIKLLSDAQLEVQLEYKYPFVRNHVNTIKFMYKVLYLDNQRAVLYWCFKQNANGTCEQHDVNFLIRSRHFSHNDLSLILPYLDKVCIAKQDLRWFDLHSQCGMEMSSSTHLRRDLVTLSHYHVLDILTNVQEPKCTYKELRGVRADLHSLERAGTWFLMSLMDEMAMDTYAMVGRVFSVSNSTAVLRLFQSASIPGEPRQCFTRVFTIQEVSNKSNGDFYYELHFESISKNSTTMVFRFLFFNRHVGVIYSCLRNGPEGLCEERAIYVISRHESIDHAELTVVEKVAKSACVDPLRLYHTAAHDECVYDHLRLKPPACSSVDVKNAVAEWATYSVQETLANFGQSVYHVVASSNALQPPFALRFDGANWQKITQEQAGCLSTPVSVRVSGRNRLLVFVNNDTVVLLSPSGVRSELLLREAQLAGQLPCLALLLEPTSNCSQLVRPVCKAIGAVEDQGKMNGDWLLFASDPSFVLNWRCVISEGDSESDHVFECHSESWVGACERPSRGKIIVDEQGGFKTEFDAETSPIRTPYSEIFAVGNVSVTDDTILMINDGALVGRKYSLWLRKTVNWNEKLLNDVHQYCVWPLPAQIRSMDMLC
ncbi:unnamed protein product [Caenorhabditis auriculariae]|uniref:Uncharacterized protein n=1 Tax=Caenorhabditis auriculariae TaxID=2777116 RepID=A0A8S1HJI3_9PELO|nr:unnamed protein product [Caenorhabditis auriculariae]